MRRNKTDRTGEINISKEGCTMQIILYVNRKQVIIGYFTTPFNAYKPKVKK